MSRFDDVFGKSNQPVPDRSYTEIGGTFACQKCNRYVLEAKWYQDDGSLAWTCSEGHESFIEKFL